MWELLLRPFTGVSAGPMLVNLQTCDSGTVPVISGQLVTLQVTVFGIPAFYTLPLGVGLVLWLYYLVHRRLGLGLGLGSADVAEELNTVRPLRFVSVSAFLH